MPADSNDPADTSAPRLEAEEPKSWGHQMGVGIALVLVSALFLPEGIGAIQGDSGNFLYRADDGGGAVLFGTVLVVLAAGMLIAGAFFIVRSLRKRAVEKAQ